jgi:hypothetical protein
MSLALISLVGTVLDKILPDQTAVVEAKFKLLELAQKGDTAALDAEVRMALGQLDVNKVEAATDLFRGGWRPAVGWACAAGFAYQVLARPILGWLAMNLWKWDMPPSLEMDTLMTLLFGMLGLGAYRTAERIRGKV